MWLLDRLEAPVFRLMLLVLLRLLLQVLTHTKLLAAINRPDIHS